MEKVFSEELSKCNSRHCATLVYTQESSYNISLSWQVLVMHYKNTNSHRKGSVWIENRLPCAETLPSLNNFIHFILAIYLAVINVSSRVNNRILQILLFKILALIPSLSLCVCVYKCAHGQNRGQLRCVAFLSQCIDSKYQTWVLKLVGKQLLLLRYFTSPSVSFRFQLQLANL